MNRDLHMAIAETVADQMIQMHGLDEDYYAEIFAALAAKNGDVLGQLAQEFPILSEESHSYMYSYLKAEGSGI